MKRFSLTIAALATLASLTGCGGSSDSSASDAESPSTTDTAVSPSAETSTDGGQIGDYQAALTAVSDLFTTLGAQEDVSPTSTDEANTAAGLDDTTDLVFADYTVLPDDASSGSFCLLSVPTETYIAVTYSGSLGEVDLGDGECSYDTAAAAVVGDLESDTWTTGADVMGDLLPSTVYGS